VKKLGKQPSEKPKQIGVLSKKGLKIFEKLVEDNEVSPKY